MTKRIPACRIVRAETHHRGRLLVLLGAFYVVGCSTGCTEQIQVRFGPIKMDERAIWIVPLNPELVGEEIHLAPSSPLEISFLLVNRTREHLFLRHDVNKPDKYVEVEKKAYGKTGPVPIGRGVGLAIGENECYVLLEPADDLVQWPTGALPEHEGRSEVVVRTGIYPSPGTEYVDVTIRWRLSWFSKQSAKDADAVFTKSLRVIYDR